MYDTLALSVSAELVSIIALAHLIFFSRAAF